MAEVIKMPRLSDTMTEGVIAAWHVKVGDQVSNGDLLAEVETDKATMDVESFFDGTVLHVGIEEGKGIPVGELLVIIGEKGEDISAQLAEAKEAAAAPAPEASEKVEEKAPAPTVKAEPVAPAKPLAVSSQPVVVESNNTEDGRIKASPLAKAMAKEKGIDISRVSGSGEGGRVIKKDIENYKEVAVAQVSSNGSANNYIPAAVQGVESSRDEPLSQMRKTIARRLGESKFTAPHFYLTMEINMDKAVSSRKSLNEVAPVKISFNDLVIKAAATALRQHPAVNAGWMGDSIRYNDHIHIGMAVAVDEGLIVPVIRFADQKGLVAISSEARSLATRARDKKLQPSEWEGNTFSISNLGMMGIEEFTAIINPPNSCILAIAGIVQKPIVKDGEIVAAHMMKVTLSCDHRVVDGMVGSQFLKTFKQLLEDPVRILM